jgi:hypothetical protein
MLTRPWTSSNTILSIVIAFFAFGCAGQSVVSTSDEKSPISSGVEDASLTRKAPNSLEEQKSWSYAVGTAEDFNSMSKKVGDQRFLKVLIDIKTGHTYFFDVNIYPFHADFAFRQIYEEAATSERRKTFAKNYEKEKPEFILLTIANHESSDIWTYHLWEGDEATADHIRLAHERLQKTFYNSPRIRFLATSPMHEARMKELTSVPSITSDSIYKLAKEHTFNIGRRVGVLRIVRPDEDPEALSLKPHHIVILQDPVPHLTAVAGIISEKFSTPLAHVNLRAAAWGIPHIGLRDAAQRYHPLDAKPVFFEATAEGHSLRKASIEETRLIKALIARPEGEVRIPKADTTVKELRNLVQVRATDASIYGAKTANLGEIAHAKMEGINVPAGFGIPVAFYAEHVKESDATALIDETLKEKRFSKDTAYRKEKLAEIRKLIGEADINSDLLEAVMARVKTFKLAEGKGVFVRSSTNAEDLPGFTGAGLYTTVPNVTGEEAIGKAIKEVWASVWNYRAYEERQFHGIDHKAVLGAVMIQVGMNATAAGVLVTSNVFDSLDRSTYTINAKYGLGMRVVGGKKVPEQILYTPAKSSIKIISRSDETTKLVFDKDGGVKEETVPKGNVILTDSRIRTLGGAAEKIQNLFSKAGPQDIEWLFVGEELHIVQSRPFVTR